MSGPQFCGYDSIARRWLALIERRQENFLDMCDTGRWRHYYTEVEFLDEMRKVLRVRDQWAALVGLPSNDQPALPSNQAAAPDAPSTTERLRAASSAVPASPWPG